MPALVSDMVRSYIYGGQRCLIFGGFEAYECGVIALPRLFDANIEHGTVSTFQCQHEPRAVEDAATAGGVGGIQLLAWGCAMAVGQDGEQKKEIKSEGMGRHFSLHGRSERRVWAGRGLGGNQLVL